MFLRKKQEVTNQGRDWNGQFWGRIDTGKTLQGSLHKETFIDGPAATGIPLSHKRVQCCVMDQIQAKDNI
eukprot:1497597-Amphidinium_carterae.1